MRYMPHRKSPLQRVTYQSPVRPIAVLLRECAMLLQKASLDPALVKEAMASLELSRKKHAFAGKAARGKSGRKPRAIPWEQVDQLRAEGHSWEGVAYKLEISERIRFSPRTFSIRHKQRKKKAPPNKAISSD